MDGSEWREYILQVYATRRATEGRKLRNHMAPACDPEGDRDHAERARIRESLRKDSCRVAFLEAVPPTRNRSVTARRAILLPATGSRSCSLS
jgi:hypothetical protein